MTINFESKSQLVDLIYFAIIKDIIVNFVPNNVDSDTYCFAMTSLDHRFEENLDCEQGAAIYKRTDDPDHPELILSIMRSPDIVYITLNAIDPSIVFRIEVMDSGAFDFKAVNIDKPSLEKEKREAADYVFNIVKGTLISIAEKF